MGSKLLSTDMLVNIYMAPMNKAYQFHDYDSAANLLYQFNSFMRGFDFGIKDLPPPKDPIATEIHSRMNPGIYYKNYFDRYSPLLSLALGKYQREILDQIQDERGS